MVRAAEDNEYHDPELPGSLSGALRMWQVVRAGVQETVPHHLIFTISCPSESRAGRVAGYLRRNLACAAVQVSSPKTVRQGRWLVEGATHFELQTLARLERLSAWLRQSASKHQVYLVGLALAQKAPVTA